MPGPARTNAAGTPGRDMDFPVLLLRADAGQVARNALVQADDALGKLVHGGDQGKPHGSHDQRVFHQILSLLVAK